MRAPAADAAHQAIVPEAPASHGRLVGFALAAAGPVVIVAAVLVVMRGYAFRGMITTQHGDILEQWLPVFDHLGRTLRSGHIPAFDPYSLAGVPFAADPQTGWMYLPAMLLFTALPSAVAIRWFLVLQPILAGLGVYGFLRAERTNRPAATAGGLVMALVLASSFLGLEIPFAGAIAWTSVTLAAAARLVRAERTGPRLVWLALTALGWGQIAGAHLSHGLVIGTGLLTFYLAYGMLGPAVRGRRAWTSALGWFALTLIALPAVNLAVLLPRVVYLPHTTLGLGYTKLADLLGDLTRTPQHAVGGAPIAVGSTWVLGLASAPGAYLGAIALALAFAGLWSKRHRGLAITLLAFGAVAFVAALRGLALWLRPHIAGLPFADFYLHTPARFRIGAVLVLPILIGLGVHAWCEPATLRRRAAMLAPGVAVWWVANALVGPAHAFPTLFLLGSLAAVAVLALTAWRPALAWLIPSLLLVELMANGVLGARVPRQATGSPWTPNVVPMVNAGDYLREGAIARAIATGGDGRFVTLAPKGQDRTGRHVLLAPAAWAALGDQRAILFGLQDAGGYNPTQLVRYWQFVRAVDRRRIHYNAAFFVPPVPAYALDLLNVRWEVAPTHAGPADPIASLVTTEGRWSLYERSPAPGRASLLGSWRVVGSPGDARRAVTAPGFDPSAEAVLERDPGLGTAGLPPGSAAGSNPGTAVYRSDGPASGTVLVNAAGPGIVLIRNPFGPGWHATLDGRPVPLLATDFVDQGVAVPAGSHVIRVRFEDPSIGWGALGSGIALLLLLGTAGIATLVARRREGADLAALVERSDHGRDA
jgi:hypothetical protein